MYDRAKDERDVKTKDIFTFFIKEKKIFLESKILKSKKFNLTKINL